MATEQSNTTVCGGAVEQWECKPNLRWVTRQGWKYAGAHGGREYDELKSWTILQQTWIEQKSGRVEWRDVPHGEEQEPTGELSEQTPRSRAPESK